MWERSTLELNRQGREGEHALYVLPEKEQAEVEKSKATEGWRAVGGLDWRRQKG